MRKKRAVAYVRVSSASSAQIHSYEFQAQYWRDKFTDDPDTELIGLYADRGITGSSVYKRPQFLAMMQDARAGKFDVVYTKSVSRFARNTVQLLEAVRELRDLGISVVFEKEQIVSSQPTSELYMTIAATIAENDLQVDSQRQKWSVRRRYENGWISIGSGMYGYVLTKDNELEIVPEEAAVVQRIYEMYIGGAGCTKIAKTLDAEGIPNRIGGKWRKNTILSMLDNEKYMGDAMMGKSVYIDGVKCDNSTGQYGKRYYMEDTHEPIVSKEIYQLAKEIRQQRKNPKLVGSKQPRYPFTGLIHCGCCGGIYRHKVNNCGKAWRSDIWVCATQLQQSVADCVNTRLKDTVLREKFVEVYNEFVTKRPQGSTIDALRQLVSELQAEETELAGLHLQHMIPEAAYKEELKSLKSKQAELKERIEEIQGKAVTERDYTQITEFDAEKVKKFISKVIVQKGTVTFVFYNGVEICRSYTNGPAGNQVGWKQKKEASAWQS